MHYGYNVTTIQGDMRDLSDLADESFDLVYGTGTCYIPDVHEVFVGVVEFAFFGCYEPSTHLDASCTHGEGTCKSFTVIPATTGDNERIAGKIDHFSCQNGGSDLFVAVVATTFIASSNNAID